MKGHCELEPCLTKPFQIPDRVTDKGILDSHLVPVLELAEPDALLQDAVLVVVEEPEEDEKEVRELYRI